MLPLRHAVLAALFASGIAGAQAPAEFVPVTDAMLQNPDPADWLMWRRTLDSWGHSPLTEINRGNVADLRMVWTRALGPGIQEGTPLVYDGVMYFPNPSDLIQAFNAATGDMLWEYRRSLPSDLGDYFPVPSINRNLAIYGNSIIDTSSDNFVFAIDARTGELQWETQLFDYRRGAQQTSGPIIANGKIVSGRGCEPEGSPAACVIMAHDARTGRELWRRRTIAAPGEPNGDSWGDLADEERWHVGSWLVPSYDPELDLVFAGTSVTSPAPKFAIAGNERNTSTTTRRSRSTPTRVRSSGTTSTSSTTGTSIIRSSGCSSRRPWRPTVTRSPGSTRASNAASGVRSSRVFQAKPASSTRSTAPPASSSGRVLPCNKTCSRASTA
jgi:alcohol dehydrogenase (cytochrome c)